MLPDLEKLTVEEQDVLRKTGDLMMALSRLPVLHSADVAETVRDIHNIQNRILARAAYKKDSR